MKNKLNRKMDAILRRENAGVHQKTIQNRTLRKLASNPLSIFGIVVFVLIMVLCVGAPLFTPYDGMSMSLAERYAAPSADHWLGCDQIGRDIWARILFGGRISIGVGLGSALIATILGVSLGTIAGFKGGLFDGIVMKISEIMMAFPQMILVLIMVTITGPSLWNLIFIFAITGWPSMYRMTRSQMLSLREEEYVQALNAFGISPMTIAFKHILPNAIGPIFVNITLSTAMFILQETALSFMNLGVPLDHATWGNILNVAQDITVLKDYWWMWLPAGIMVTLFVLSINFIGDGLRDATDPTQIG